MNKIKIFIFATLAIYIVSCRNEFIVDSNNLYITFNVDSIKIYDAKDMPKGEFIFSPLSLVDKIWMTGTYSPFELDLKTGLWVSLKTKYNDQIKGQLREELIWNDSFTGETYISLFHDGLLRYYKDKDTFEHLNINPVTALLPRKNHVVIGTANGLYFLNREDNKITVANNFPLDFWVNSIHDLQDDTLIINNVKYFHIPTSKIGNRVYNTQKSQNGYNFRHDSNHSKIPGFLGGYQELGKVKTAWYYSQNLLYYTKDNHSFYSFKNFPEGIVRHIKQDEKYLYILYEEQFVILNKAYIFKQATLYTHDEYQFLKNELWNKMKELDQSSLSFEEYLNKAIFLYNDKSYSDYSDLQSNISNIPLWLNYFSYEINSKQINEKLNDKNIPEEFKLNILKGLCQKYTREVKLKEAMFCFEKLKTLFPSYTDECIERSYPCVSKLYSYLDSLKKENLARDKFLFLEATARENLVHCSCWFGESYYHYEIVEEKYKELLSNFPQSEFADNAEFWLRSSQYYDAEGGGYQISDIPDIIKLIKKYPTSELIPDLIIDIAHSYASDYQEHTDERIKSLNKGIQELENLKQNYTLDSLQEQRVEQLIGQYKQDINDAIFDLTIFSIKSNYKDGEDIEIEVELKNNSQVPRKIYLYKNHSLFTFHILPSKNEEFIASGIVDTAKQEYIIINEKPIRQTIKLNRNARYWNGGQLGTFSFKKDGLYYVSCSSRLNSLGSNQCKIYIQKE